MSILCKIGWHIERFISKDITAGSSCPCGKKQTPKITWPGPPKTQKQKSRIMNDQCCRKCWEKEHDKKAHSVDDALINPIGMPFIVCSICGNKRCPHATDHNLPCTNSNEPGQKGSIY